MGLSITAFSHLAAVDHLVDDWCEEHEMVFAYDSFPASFRGVPILGASEGFSWGGCYAQTDATETHRFDAGSYGGYGRWRSNLQEQFNPDLTPDGPFYELLWFADNEGCIGPDAARDLLADFREHEATYVPPRHWTADTYRDWARAFELAADSGAVLFR